MNIVEIPQTEPVTDSDHEPFYVRFNVFEDNGMHEAPVALNGIAAFNRRAFDNAYSIVPSGATESGYDKLVRATAPVIEIGLDRLARAIQQSAREKSREGLLTDTLSFRIKKNQLVAIRDGLVVCRDDTVDASRSEPRNTAGNSTVFGRAMEAITADQMIRVIEDKFSLDNPLREDDPPMGFGRVLFDHAIDK